MFRCKHGKVNKRSKESKRPSDAIHPNPTEMMRLIKRERANGNPEKMIGKKKIFPKPTAVGNGK